MDYDVAYSLSEFIPNAESYGPRQQREAAEFRARRKDLARLGQRYGPSEREAYDLFLPDGVPQGLLIYVHGGFWHLYGREDWSGFAAGAAAWGWAVAIPSYTLAPEAHISAITHQIAQAIEAAAGELAGPIVLAGHGSGGHLVARMNCRDVALNDATRARIRRIVPISPISDLRPLLRTRTNAKLRLGMDEASAESPALSFDRRGIETLVWVGAEERPVFLDQAIGLAEAWDEARLHVEPGRHHFDVIRPLMKPESGMVSALLGGIEPV
ncbi:MAG: alpha/beta hydrolase fold domain-containing protein [Maritimibacter sp.]